MTTHSDLWRRAVDEAYRRPGADGRVSLVPVTEEDADGMGVADEDGVVREVDCVCPYGNDVCDCPSNVAGDQ